MSKILPMPFLQRSRRDRRELYVRLRWEIKKYAATCGGRFVTDAVLPDADSNVKPQWLDFCFLGAGSYRIWNATVVTARHAFEEAVERMAFDSIWDEASDAESCQECGYPDAAGDDRMTEICRRMTQIAYDDPPEVRECAEIDSSSEYGIGLDVVGRAEGIDRQVVEAVIQRFLAGGEKGWEADSAEQVESLLPVDGDFQKYSSNLPVAIRL